MRVIVDGLGCATLPWDFIEGLKDSKVELVEFRPLVLPQSWQRLGRRDHRKILVVDGQISFCGGINIGDEYRTGDSGSSGWRDTHLQIQGPVTAQLEDLFRQTWDEHGGRSYRRYPSDVGFDSVALEPILAVALPSDEAGQRGTIRRHYLHAIGRARRSIDIANAYFVPNRQFLAALCTAARRGVAVRLLLPNLEHNDVVVAQLASQHTYRRLLDAGVQIYQWPGAHMHAKTAVIDGVWGTVGSYNLDAMSLFQNLEVVVEVVSESFGARLQSMFERDFAQAIEIDSDAWRRRGAGQRILEPLFYRFRRLL